ncbi:uncharacterized protein LOC124358900 [Homalodisca vitripennis]|nr:uncharacterized protein LOC124358900 [Homalodisca vitripennis]
MKRNNHFQALLFATLFTLNCLTPPAASACSGTSSAVVSALLPLHTGSDCSALQLRGLQQLAALRAVVNEINNELKPQDGLTIGLQVQDTCSTPDGAMRAAMRSLVDVQQTCSNPPLYLGMLGPEDAESLAKVKGVSRVFNATHVLPNFLSSTKEAEEDTVFFVSMERHKEQAQSVITLLKQLHWQSFSVAFEESMAELAEVLIQTTKEDSTVCVKGAVSRLSALAVLPNIFAGSQDGVVVLTDTHQMAAKVLQAYQALTTPMILLVRTVGLETWQIPRSASKMYLLQQVSTTTEDVPETMNVTLKTEYETQRQAEFQNIHCKDITNAADCAIESSTQDNLLENVDVSVTSMANAVRLVASALRSVHRVRCMAGTTPTFGMCPKLMALPAHEWRNALRRATAVTKNSDNHRVRFLMELSTNFNIYSRDNIEGNLMKVGSIVAGNMKEVAKDYTFPVMQHASNVTACGATPTIPIAPPHIPPPTTTFDEDSIATLKDIYTSEYSFYELVGMICGVGFIMFGIMALMIYLIYNSLVEKTEKEVESGSVDTVRTSRPARRNFRDTFRRNSSVRSSTHS